MTTAGTLLLALGLIAGCGSSGASGSRSTSAKSIASPCSKLPLSALATALGEPKLVAGPVLRLKPPICGLRPPGGAPGESLVILVIASPATKAGFTSRIKYYQSIKQKVDVRSLSNGQDMLYVVSPHSSVPSQNMVIFSHGLEYQVTAGPLATKPFTESQLLRAARLLIGA